MAVVVPSSSSHPKVSGWMKCDEIVHYLEYGDLIEIQRDLFQHWAVFIEKIDGKAYVIHLTGGEDNDLSDLSVQSCALPLALVRASREGFRRVPYARNANARNAPREGMSRSRSAPGGKLKSVFQASMQDSAIAEVKSEELSLVARGSKCRINNYNDSKFAPFTPERIVTRATCQLGRQKYNLLFTNCEHFVKWCRYGSKSSQQASTAKSLAVGACAAALSGSMVLGMAAGTACFLACGIGNQVRNRYSRAYQLSW